MASIWEPVGVQLEALNQYLQERPLVLLSSVVLIILSSGLLWRCVARYNNKKKKKCECFGSGKAVCYF